MYYRKEIDGLRAIAVFPVILFHAGFASFGGGYVGVDVFFVISGYLITSIILKEREQGTFTLIGFYERRARRILPALSLVMICCIPFAWSWMLPSEFKEFGQSLVATSLFSSNILFWLESGYFEGPTELKPLLHTWSLGVEEQYYLLFPLFLIATQRIRKALVLTLLGAIAIASLIVAQWASTRYGNANFYLLPTRGWELLIGVFCAFYLKQHELNDQPRSRWINEILSITGLLLIAISVFGFNSQTPFPSVWTLCPTLGTALIILFGIPTTYAGTILGYKPVVGVGLISYSLYLWHQPLFVFARIRSLEQPSAFVFIALSLVALALSWASWRFVERPFRNRSGFLTQRAIFSSAALSIILIGACGLSVTVSDGFKDRWPDWKDVDVATLTSCTFDGSAVPVCRQRSPGVPRVALIGDSHADALSSYFAANEQYRNDVTLLSRAGCLPIRGLSRSGKVSECSEYNDRRFEYLKNAADIEIVIIAARWSLNVLGERFDNGEGGVEYGNDARVYPIGDPNISEEDRIDAVLRRIQEEIMAFVSLNKHIIVINQIPEVGWSPVDRLLKEKRFGDITANDMTASTSSNLFYKRNAIILKLFEQLENHEDLTLLSPHKILCNRLISGRCITFSNSYPLYLDDDHVSGEGAALVFRQLCDSNRLSFTNSNLICNNVSDP